MTLFEYKKTDPNIFMPQGMPVKLASPDGSTSFFGSLFIRMSKAVCSTNVQTVYNIGRMKKEEAIRNLGAQEAHVLKNTTYANTSSPRTIAQKDGDVKKLAKIEETSASSMPYKTGTAIGAEVSSSGDIIPKTAQNEEKHFYGRRPQGIRRWKTTAQRRTTAWETSISKCEWKRIRTSRAKADTVKSAALK